MAADYERLIADIEQQVKTGKLKPGDRLPSIARLAEIYDTSATTVKSALAILRREGKIRTQQGKGTWIADAPSAEG